MNNSSSSFTQNPNSQAQQIFPSFSMADMNTVEEESGFPEKRKSPIPDSIYQNLDDKKEVDISDSNKKQKHEVPSENNDKNGKSPYISVEKTEESKEFENASAATDDEDDEEDYVAEEDEGDDDDGEEDSNEESEACDRKGKGIVINEKGKGKMIVVSEDDDSSDDSDSNFSDGLNGSDVEDDLFDEIDLDNILPSRTRKRGVQPGVRISNNCENKGD